jgi:hypothetical protein
VSRVEWPAALMRSAPIHRNEEMDTCGSCVLVMLQRLS